LVRADCGIARKVRHVGVIIILISEVTPYVVVSLKRNHDGDRPTADVPTFRTNEELLASACLRAWRLQKQFSYRVIVSCGGRPAENSDQVELLGTQEFVKGPGIDNEIEMVSTSSDAFACKCGFRPSAPAE
jgi:hypothetical protein